jgi:CDGSH-type Zn-finger protein/uncharacterized Fe-S cluster protein YjdI
MSDAPSEHRGKSLVVRFDGKKCIHARQCVLGRPDVFVPDAPGEWIHPDAAPAEDIAAIARTCPSGAITYERLDGAANEAPPPANVVRVLENGPLAFHAAIQMAGQTMTRATLCRCGHSQNKPYCDGAHTERGFRATGEPTSVDSPPLAERGGKLDVRPLRNGPLVVIGNLEICTGTGHTVERTEKISLCRCGASYRKPFCDGSHARIGFTTEP